jgi:hypothetical protein
VILIKENLLSRQAEEVGWSAKVGGVLLRWALINLLNEINVLTDGSLF